MRRLWIGIVAAMILPLIAFSWGATNSEILIRDQAQFEFRKSAAGGVSAYLWVSFKNSTGRNLCIVEQSIPGSEEFDISLLELTGPNGKVPFREASTTTIRGLPHVRRVYVLFPNALYEAGVEVTRENFQFDAPGRYQIRLRVPVGDCGALGRIAYLEDDAPGWFIGYIVVEAFGFKR